MRKKFITMITVCITATLLLSVTASAYYLTGKCGKNLEWGLDLYDSQIDIWGTGDMQNFNLSDKTEMSDRWGGIPSSIKRVDIDEGVTSIGNHAFSICLMLKEVKLPNTLVSIGEDAFGSCSNLEKIEIPEGTKEIGNFAFLMSALKDITIPSTLTKIGLSAFDSNNDLNIHISDIAAWCNVERFGFRGNANNIKTNLYIGDEPATNITIPNGTKKITGGAFWIISNVKSITIPKSVTDIEKDAFNKNITLNVYENSAAHKYAIENSIPYNIMSYPNTIGNSITISNLQKNGDKVSFTTELSSREEIQGTIFAAVYDTNGALTNIKRYPAAASNDISIKKQDNDYTAKIFWWFDTDSMYPMADCAEIKLNEVEKTYSINKDYDNTRGSVTVTENGQKTTTAAEGKQITIETSPKSGYGVLSITVTDTSGNIIEIKNNTFTMPKGDVNIAVTFVGTKDSGTFGINNNLTWLLDDNGTLTISGNGQMQDFTSSNTPWNKYNSDIKIIVIKNGVTRISKNAFADCSKMKRVLIDKNVTEIEAAAFKNCADLSIVEYSGSQSDWEEIYIGAENEQLKNANFIYNSSLSDTAQTYLDYLKYTKNEDNTITITNCLADAVKINIPKEIGGLPVTTIGENAFSGCGGLTSITIPDSITSIEDYAFSSCPLTNIVIPYSVTNLGIGVFSGCSDIKTATIGNGVTNISELTFSGCGGLTSIIISDSVTAIGGQAFYDCSSLTDIKISNKVTSIGDSAFSGCSGLTNITIPDSVTNIGGSAFNNCSGLKDVYISNIAAWCNIEFGNASSNPMYYANKLYVNNKFLTNVKIPESVTSIRNYTFYNCSHLTIVTIPDSVTSIGNAAFYNCTDLTNIIIPDSITNIGGNTFYGCSGLTNITIGNSVTSIDENAFQNCSNLDSVYLSDIAAYLNIDFGNEYSNPMYYANKLYLNNKRVTSVEIPDGVTKIPDYAFYGCDSITDVTISNSVESIGNSVFKNCSGLTSITIPDNVINIGNSTFEKCNNLASITIPDSVISIGYSTFNGCSSLKSATIGKGIESIGSVFQGCNNIEEITLPFVGSSRTDNNTYTAVFGYIFGQPTKSPMTDTILQQYGSGYLLYMYYYIPSSLKKVTITDTQQLPYGAFYNCDNLTSVTIPDSVTNIGNSAFYGCSGLSDVYYNGSFKDFAKIYINNYNSYFEKAKLHCTDITTDNWGKCGSNIIYSLDDNGTLTMAGEGDMQNYSLSSNSSFNNNRYIKNIIIENGITSIGNYAFTNCSGLTSITIPSSVTSIGSSAFNCCSSLKAVYITDVEKWCGISFYNSTSNPMSYAEKLYINNEVVTEIAIPNSVTSIASYAFYCCSNLTSITIPDGVTNIGKSTFTGCSSLTSINVDDTNRNYCSIDGNLFNKSKTQLIRYSEGKEDKSYIIPDSVTNIGDSAFSGCKNLTSITVPDSVTNIGDSAFSGCKNLTSITVPDSVTSIGNDAFRNCSGLTSVTIPNSVTSIGNSAFQWCGLTSVTIPDSVTTIGDYTFYDCSRLRSITIPSSIKSIGSLAFYNCGSLAIVYYIGSEDDWKGISIIGDYNTNLTNAYIIYNYVSEE